MRSGQATAAAQEIDLGGVRVRPGIRTLEGPAARVTLEPLVMRLLVQLSYRAGEVVSREDIIQNCWGSATVGDDSLNRVVAALRRALARAGEGLVAIETVPRAGYLLRLSPRIATSLAGAPPVDAKRAIDEGLESVRLGLPQPDYLRIEVLRRAVVNNVSDARAWGMLALLCRHAAEYAEQPLSSQFLTECERSARRALELDRDQEEARVALATVAPLFGRWLEARQQLSAICSDGSFVAAHELAIVEMATGRVNAAKAIMDGLLQREPLAACLHYKTVYQNWSIGNLTTMDHAADRALQLWPQHPAIWTARFWTLAYTDRAHAALHMLDGGSPTPPFPAAAFRLLRMVAHAVVSDDLREREEAAEASRQAAQAGPSLAISSLFGLGLLGRTDDQLKVARAYFLGEGPAPVPARHMPEEPSINEQHRRVSQILFTPACASLRSHHEFGALCERIGLTRYWIAAQLRPDFMNEL